MQLQEQRLEVHASPDNFALRKHNLVQAMLAVNDMFYLVGLMVASLFYEDVVAWLDLHDIRYTPKVKFTGKTGYDHLFDFRIPKSGASRSGLSRPSTVRIATRRRPLRSLDRHQGGPPARLKGLRIPQ